MPIHRERYRRREDGVDVQGRAWLVIAAHGLRALVRKRPLIFLLLIAWLPAIVRAVQIYAAANLPSVSQVGFLAITPRTFRDFLGQQDPFVFFLTVYAGSGLIADDLRARALQLYLSRPVTTFQYVAGKAAILMIVLASVTWLPAMLLLFLVPIFAGNMAFLTSNLFLLPAISAYAVVHITLVALLMLALSATSHSRWFVAIMYAGITLFSHAVFGVINAAADGSMFSPVSIFANLDQVGDALFRLPPRYDTPVAVSAAVIAAIIGASMLVLRQRVRAVEVVT